jgi:hypothetical protein
MSYYSGIKINVFEVLNLEQMRKSQESKEIKIQYKFGELKKTNGTNRPIKPIDPYIDNININKTKFFSQNIIETKNKNKNDKNESLKEFLNKQNLKKLYNIYLLYSTRIQIKNFISIPNNNLYKSFSNSLLNKSIKIMKDYFNNIFNKLPDVKKSLFGTFFGKKQSVKLIIPFHNSEIIYRINADDDEKIIIMGDNHGSFHSFLRIFIRLYIKGVIDCNYKLKDGYRIVFLGDLIDRGNFGIEIMYIIFNLINVNNSHNQLNVILIRGNHEEYGTFNHYGFSEEIVHKFQTNSNNIIQKFYDFYSYCPSAIILTHLNTTYWLCHGGFPIKLLKKNDSRENMKKQIITNYDTQETDRSVIISRNIIKRANREQNNLDGLNNLSSNGFSPNTSYIPKKNELGKINNVSDDSSQIRWNDFNKNSNTQFSKRNREKGTMFNIGTNDLISFLERTKIDFIIRGHKDDVSNAMLLSNMSNKDHFIMNDLNNKEYYENHKSIPIINYPFVNGRKTIDEIATINPKLFNRMGISVGEGELYPVLTISNNSDNDRMQYPDSYVVIQKI